MNTTRKILKYCIGLPLLFLILGIIVLSFILEPAIPIDHWQKLDKSKLTDNINTITILDDDGAPINDYLCDEKIIYTHLSQIPQSTIDAFVSIEDKRFFCHNGIDTIRIAGAFKRDIENLSFKEGASTITQQLIKNTHLSNEKSISRKLQEMRIAIDLERNFTKNEILEMYLNVLYFGSNIYGIGSAAKKMFGKNTSDLSLSESALLAAIINNPDKYNPYKNSENALNRRNLILSQMLKDKKISNDEFDTAVNEPITMVEFDNINRQYINNVVKEASEILNCSEQEIFTSNLTIATNLNNKIQLKAHEILANLKLKDNPLAQVIVINNKNSKVVSAASNTVLNLAYSYRQPGSVLKPLIAYAPMLEKNSIVPITPILDEKMSFGSYSPSNYKNRYEGWTSIENSLINSSNVCAVKLLDMNGIKNAKSYATDCGIKFDKKDNSLALALGAMQKGTTLLQLANTYQVFAAEGKFIKSSCIKYIKNQSGEYLYEAKNAEKQVFSSETTFFINDMLKNCANRGTAKLLNGVKNICAKTGTVGDASGNTDAYCIAYNPEYTIAVWIGSKNNRQKHSLTGGGYPTHIAKNLILAAEMDTFNGFSKPDSICEVEIDLMQLKDKHKVIAADDTVLPKNKQIALFLQNNPPYNSNAIS